MFKPCIVIPVFNHGMLLQKNIGEILSFNVPLILINDGSDLETSKILTEIAAENKQIILHNLSKNYGKGAALRRAFFIAFENSFTHAVQIDADGQHQISDILKFIKLAKSNPEALINGHPIYNKTSPKSRFYGRKITNFWVAIETISFDIKDAMCGFRVYPLAKTTAIFNQKNVSKRMGFDIEIIVLLCWHGVKIINQPTLVKYPADGLSNFKMFRDNLQISILHGKLFFGMLCRIPSLIKNVRK